VPAPPGRPGTVAPVPPDPAADEDAADAGGFLRVSAGCTVALSELRWRFTTSGGPGGQHANKVATRAEVRFDVATSPSLTESQRERLEAKLGPVVTVAVDETRSQSRNRALALERLRARLAGGLVRSRPRRPTKPSRGSVERRLTAKKQRSQTKRQRRTGYDD
jgi:ribosome-associated protein